MTAREDLARALSSVDRRAHRAFEFGLIGVCIGLFGGLIAWVLGRSDIGIGAGVWAFVSAVITVTAVWIMRGMTASLTAPDAQPPRTSR